MPAGTANKIAAIVFRLFPVPDVQMKGCADDFLIIGIFSF
jgi:hypothetical protein